jgi:hypothetical protein
LVKSSTCFGGTRHFGRDKRLRNVNSLRIASATGVKENPMSYINSLNTAADQTSGMSQDDGADRVTDAGSGRDDAMEFYIHDDRYDDGLVHSHNWAVSTPER